MNFKLVRHYIGYKQRQFFQRVFQLNRFKQFPVKPTLSVIGLIVCFIAITTGTNLFHNRNLNDNGVAQAATIPAQVRQNQVFENHITTLVKQISHSQVTMVKQTNGLIKSLLKITTGQQKEIKALSNQVKTLQTIVSSQEDTIESLHHQLNKMEQSQLKIAKLVQTNQSLYRSATQQQHQIQEALHDFYQ